jgi:NADH-quinone oxidoreductase subunit I
MKSSPRQLLQGFWSLLSGMRITLAQFFKPAVTVQYPHETLKMPARYRGHIILVRDPETGKSLCIACKSCEKACPSDCIVVEGIKREGEKRKSVTEFKLDFTKCSLCGSCVEVCPTDALEFSKAYNLASTQKEQFHCIDLVRRLEADKE